MVDLIKLLVDCFGKAVHFAATSRKKREIIELGGQLYNVYISLAGIIVLARRILVDIDSINEDMSTREIKAACRGILISLNEQANNLRVVTEEISVADQQLIVLNANSRIRLDGLLRGKHGIINGVIGELKTGNLIMGVLAPWSYEDLLAEVEGNEPNTGNTERYFFELARSRFYIRPEEQSWIAEQFPGPAYANQNDIINQIEDINSVLSELRVSLENSFDINDMMLHVSRRNKQKLKSGDG